MLLLAGSGIDALKSHRNHYFRTKMRRAVEAKRAAQLACAFLHHRNAKMAAALEILRKLKTVAVISHREYQRIALVVDPHVNLRGLRVAHGVRYRFLPNTDQVMHRSRSDWNLFSLDIELCGYGVPQAMPGKRAAQRLRQIVSQLIGIAQVPDDAPCFRLAV